jgi:DNA-binding response OmpR family regulator
MNINTILIIDDEIEVCFLLQKYLIKKNKNADFSTTLKEGLEKFKIMKPDLLILDHNLAAEFGIENIPTFKSLHDSSLVVIISAMHNLRDEALLKGADYFLEKPISCNAIYTML